MDYIKRLIEQRKAEIENLKTRNQSCTDPAELRSIGAEIAKTMEELRSAEAELARLEAAAAAPAANPFAGVNNNQERTATPGSGMEYRQAFMNYIVSGTPIPAELRAAATTTQDIGALIPVELQNEVIHDGDYGAPYGQLYNRVRKMNRQFGIEFPLANFNPQLKWVAENSCSTPEKVEANDRITFKAHLGSVMVGVSFVADATSLEAFERELVTALRQAFYKAMDTAIIKGTGVGSPLGITADPRVTTKVLLTEKEFGDFKEWNSKVWAKVPVSKRDGSLIIGNTTAYTILYNMVDGNGRPMYNEITDSKVAAGILGRFMGREVILVEDTILSPFGTASNKEVVAVYAPLYDYGVNSNMQFGIKRYEDPKCHENITEGLVILDGKPLDVRGMVLIQKSQA